MQSLIDFLFMIFLLCGSLFVIFLIEVGLDWYLEKTGFFDDFGDYDGLD